MDLNIYIVFLYAQFSRGRQNDSTKDYQQEVEEIDHGI